MTRTESGSEPPSSLALDDIMLIEDEEEGNQNLNTDISKISNIQDQLQKQAEIIRDLLVQRDYLINQILQERDRWQAEREGWDRTSEALIARHARKDKDSDSGKEEELTRQCAVYESDNRALKEKLHDTQARLTDLEAELSKLRPLLVMQPHLLLRQNPTRRPMPYPYAPMQNYISPFPPALTQYAPFSLYNETTTPNRGRKRRKSDHAVDPSSNKGKEKEGPANEDGSDSNGDGDTDTEAPPTPTPAPSSWNPYAYMNDFYRHPSSPSKPSPLKPPNVLNSPTMNAYAVSYSYPYSVSPFPKPLSASNSGASVPPRPDNADKEGSQGDSNTECQKDKSHQSSSPLKTTTRRTAASRIQHQGKTKTSTFLSDARTEHLLLAARRIGRERAAAIAGIIKVQDKPVVVPEDTASVTKDKAKGKEQASGVSSNSTVKRPSPSKSRPMPIQSPTTPTPRRIHGPGDKVLFSSPLARPSVARSRDTLASSTPSGTKTLSTNSNEDIASGSGQTPLDSLLSAARTMMSEDCEAFTHGQRLGDATGVDEKNVCRGQKRGVEESVQRKKRRRNRSPATPRLRTEKQRGNVLTSGTEPPDRDINSTVPAKCAPAGAVQAHSSAVSTQRTRSALDVLADQAAAASSDGSGGGGVGSNTTVENPRSEADDQGAVHDRPSTPRSPTSYSAPQPGEYFLAFMRDHAEEETTQVVEVSNTTTNKPPVLPVVTLGGVSTAGPLLSHEAPPVTDTTTTSTTKATPSSPGSETPSASHSGRTAKTRRKESEIQGTDPFGSRPNLGGTIIVCNEPGAECTSKGHGGGGDLDAEGDDADGERIR